MAIKSISKSELEVMKIIWDFGRAVQYADVAGKLEEKITRGRKYSTNFFNALG